MKKSELQEIIREEIMKSLITEKFASKKITNLFKLMDSKDRKFFDTTAKSRGFAWSDVEDANVLSGATPSNDHMNIFIVDSRKENPFQSGWEGAIYPGIIGITIGKKSMYWPQTRWRDSKSSSNMIGNQGRKLDNYKRYSEVADRVLSIALSDIPSAKEKQAARADSKRGATALMKNKDVVDQNMKRYKKLLQAKVMAKGPDALKKMLDDATAVTEKVFKFTTDMLKKGMYSTGWDSYQTISSQYGNMVRAYESYVRDAAEYAKEKGDERLDSWRKDYVASRAGEVKGYYQELLKKAKIVMDKKNYKPIVKEMSEGTINEGGYVVIDPRGNARPIGSKIQGDRYVKGKRGHYVILAKHALKARRAIEKAGGNSTSRKIQDLMFDLRYEGKIKLKNVLEANPDGTISKGEDKERAKLLNDFEKTLVVKWNKEYNSFVKNAMKIGGTFRGPGIKKQLQDKLKDWTSRMTK
tara:strand:- start:216 stop:1619 length:1404 start_codon:yes stop_codon:yes gene_type:complete